MLILPPPLLAAFLGLAYAHMWYRLGQQSVPHRWVFSACNMTAASAAGGAVLLIANPQTYPALPHGMGGFVVIAGATLARWVVNRTLSSVALLLLHPGTRPGQAFGFGANDLIECAALALGVLAAVLMTDEPATLLALMVVVLVVHRILVLHEFSTAHRDRVTGLHGADFWHEMAGKAVERAQARRSTVGLLLIHLDDLDAITSRYGTTVGHRLLRRFAESLSTHVRHRDDLAGRLPGDDIGVVLPDVTKVELAGIAERIRVAVHELTVVLDGADGDGTSLRAGTVSIGGALYPDHAGS